MSDMLDLIEELRREIDRVTGIANLPQERNIDTHPLRYSPLVCAIERILISRELGRQPNGYIEGTLPTAIKIAEAIQELPSNPLTAAQ